MTQLINYQKFTNIQNAQAGLTRLFLDAKKTSSFYQIFKNDQSLGVLIPEDMWKSITEDLEALSSVNYRKRIAKIRKEKRLVSSTVVKKQLGI